MGDVLDKGRLREFLDGHGSEESRIVEHLRQTVRTAAPELSESIRRGSVQFVRGDDDVVCYLWPLRSCVQVGLRNGEPRFSIRKVRTTEEAGRLAAEIREVLRVEH